LANLLAKQAFDLGFKPVILPFAGPLKGEANNRGFTKEDKPNEYREFCQVHGALKREQDPNYWVKKFEEKLLKEYEQELSDLKENKPYWQRVVIADDCRYENELSIGKKHKACTIFVSPGKRNLDDMKGTWRTHHSEAMATAIENGDDDLLSLFKYVLTNGECIETLEERVRTMAPIWIGLQAENNYTKLESAEIVSELIDIFLDDLNKEEEDDEEEEDDTVYFSSHDRHS